MPARTSDRDDECPACGCEVAYGCDCVDDGEALAAGYERLEEGEPGRERTHGCVAVDLLAAIAGIALMLVAMCTGAQRIEHRAGWINGVQADGWYELRRQPHNADDETPPGALRSRIWCTGGARPIAIDYRTVGCMR